MQIDLLDAGLGSESLHFQQTPVDADTLVCGPDFMYKGFIYNITIKCLLSLCLNVSGDEEITPLEVHFLYRKGDLVDHPTNLSI